MAGTLRLRGSVQDVVNNINGLLDEHRKSTALRSAYRKSMKLGDEAMGDRKWPDAISHYRKAQMNADRLSPSDRPSFRGVVAIIRSTHKLNKALRQSEEAGTANR